MITTIQSANVHFSDTIKGKDRIKKENDFLLVLRTYRI